MSFGPELFAEEPFPHAVCLFFLHEIPRKVAKNNIRALENSQSRGFVRLSSQILRRRRLLDNRRLAARLVAFISGFITLWAGIAGLFSSAISTLSIRNINLPLSALGDALFVSGVLVLVGVLMLFLSNTGGSLVFIGGILSILMGTAHILATGFLGQMVDIAGLVALGSGIVSTAVGARRDLLQTGFPIHLVSSR